MNALQRRLTLASTTALALCVSACGGGGGGASSATTPPGGGAPLGTLQAHLGTCLAALSLNEVVPCMLGLYEGKTVDGGVPCVFNYTADGVSVYTTGAQVVRADLSLYSASSFEKKAAATPAGFSIAWAIGIASGHEMDVYYQDGREAASAGGLLIKPRAAGIPACLVENAPKAPATGGGSTANLLGRQWQAAVALHGGGGPDPLLFDAGLADNGRAFIAWRQADANGRLAVQVVDGAPGALGAAASWAAPRVLDDALPLLAGFRPRIAVSANGHAVVTWMTEDTCPVTQHNPTRAKCQYVVASRRLASEAEWEAAIRVRASPRMATTDHVARINTRGDIVLAFPGFYLDDSTSSATTLAIRDAGDAIYRIARLSSFWSYAEGSVALSDRVLVQLDDLGNVIVAGASSGVGSITRLRTPTQEVPDGSPTPAISNPGVVPIELTAGGGGWAAFTWRNADGSRQSPNRLALFSPETGAWLADEDIRAYTLWGSTALVATSAATSAPTSAPTSAADGEFTLYSGCKRTVWRAGVRSATVDLPAFCGRDQAGGTYAFNRYGDYIGIDWAGRPGQWGYYSHSQNTLLKAPPGDAASAAGDLVLGTPSTAFGTGPTQLLLAANGVALAVTSNTYTTLPSAANPVGVNGGAVQRLWAIYLK